MAASDSRGPSQQAARSEGPATIDKRDTERIPLPGDLHGEVMVLHPMAIREISHGGAQVETALPLQLESLHDFRLGLGDRSIVVKGRVAHCRISDVDQELVTYRSGIEFIELSDRIASAIAAFIEEVKRPRQGP